MYASLGQIAETALEACWNQAILGVLPRPDYFDGRFLKYALIASRPVLRGQARSNTQANLNAEQVANIRIPRPPLDEQRRIAALLDEETARLDALIRRKLQVSDLLQQKRAAVSRAAVSGELTHNSAERRQSDLTWLPTVPSQWRIAKLSLVAKLGTGHTPSRSEVEYWETERDIPWLTTSDIERFRDDRCEVLTETKESISRLGLENSSAVLHPAGTVALSRTASVGFSTIMGREMATSQDFVTWTCSASVEPQFLLLCLRAMRNDLLERLAIGSTHKTIYMPDIQGLRIPLPPIDEQRRAVELAHTEMQKIDELSARVRRQLPLLSERREALIAGAVTGQFDPTSFRASARTT